MLRALLRAARECRVRAAARAHSSESSESDGCAARPPTAAAAARLGLARLSAFGLDRLPACGGGGGGGGGGLGAYLRASTRRGHTGPPATRRSMCVRHVRGMWVRQSAACVRGMLARGPPSPLLLLSENELERLLRGASLPAPGLCASSASLRVDESAQLLLESRASRPGSAGAEAGLKKPKPKMPRFAGLGEGFGAAAGAPRWDDGCEGGRSSPGLERGRV